MEFPNIINNAEVLARLRIYAAMCMVCHDDSTNTENMANLLLSKEKLENELVASIMSKPAKVYHDGMENCLDLITECVNVLGKCDHKDHHGYCQTHFLQQNCIVEKMFDILKRYK